MDRSLLPRIFPLLSINIVRKDLWLLTFYRYYCYYRLTIAVVNYFRFLFLFTFTTLLLFKQLAFKINFKKNTNYLSKKRKTNLFFVLLTHTLSVPLKWPYDFWKIICGVQSARSRRVGEVCVLTPSVIYNRVRSSEDLPLCVHIKRARRFFFPILFGPPLSCRFR